jgi:alpha-tubulin suppressor-like RCC1 family protein
MFGCSWLRVHSSLGNGFSGLSSTPVKIGLKNATQISAGKDFSLAIANGHVWGWGEGLKYLSHRPASVPIGFANANVLAESKHTTVKKIQSA